MAIATERRATVTVTVGGQEITFESGKLAKQADGAVLVRSGDTMVLATAQGRTEAREGADFFPLTVDVEERMYAAGKIPGGFFKREGRPTERAILTARMIDRPIRPLWPKGFKNEVQVICTVLSADMVTPHDILCINGASADPLREAPRGRRRRRGAPQPALPGALDGVDRGRHRPADAGALEPAAPAREAADGRRRGIRPRAVRRRASRTDRSGAGPEGAEVREAAPPLGEDRRDGAAAVPGRADTER